MCALLVKINRLFWDIYTTVPWHLMLNFPPSGMVRNRRKNRDFLFSFFFLFLKGTLFLYLLTSSSVLQGRTFTSTYQPSCQNSLTMNWCLLYFCLSRKKFLQEGTTAFLRIFFWLLDSKKLKLLPAFEVNEEGKSKKSPWKQIIAIFPHCTSSAHLQKQIIHGNIIQLKEKEKLEEWVRELLQNFNTPD